MTSMIAFSMIRTKEEERHSRTPIDQLARDYLGLDVSFARLHQTEFFADWLHTHTEFLLEVNGQKGRFISTDQIV
jgi:uncharacterized protein (DUF2342 family)